MKRFIKRFATILCVFMIIFSCSLTAFAHSGRTDSSGGHKDNQNVSGLGSYHYHCGGYPAHLHIDGYCPYTDVFPSSVSISAGKTTLGIGEETDISGSVYPTNSCNDRLEWSCSDTSVVTIENGVIKAKDYGTATITAESFNGKVGSVKITVKEITAEKVTVSGMPEEDVYIGDAFQLSASIYPDNVDNPSIKWSSSDAAIANVTENGKVTLNSAGVVVISAIASNGVAGVWEFTVNERFVETVVLQYEELPMLLGEKKSINATVEPENATHPELEWTSDHPKIVSVSDKGEVSALACGQAVITATSTNGISTSVQITVSEIVAKSVRIEGNTTLEIGSREKFNVLFNPENTTVQDISWSVDDTDIASITKDGVVTGIEVGSTTVHVKQKDVEASLEITVLPIYVTEIVISSSVGGTIKKGETAEVTADVYPYDATYSKVTWSTSDESIATIDANGILTAHRGGKVIITAKAEDGFEATYSMKVTTSVGVAITAIVIIGAATAIAVTKTKKKEINSKYNNI